MTGLPSPLSVAPQVIDTPAGPVAVYIAHPAQPSGLPPLLLVHSVNAAGSVAEVAPPSDSAYTEAPEAVSRGAASACTEMNISALC